MPITDANEYVIRAIEFTNDAPCPIAGQYMQRFDFDANDGRGHGVFSNQISRAKRFRTKTDAWRYWNTISRVKPVREDGKPNKPFTAITVAIEPVTDD